MVNVPSAIQFLPILPNIKLRISVTAFAHKVPVKILGIVMVVLSSVALYFSYRDLVDYYKVDYTPIPRYMVDEKDITAYNDKRDKFVI